MASIEGTPWTKAWGMMYLASFLIFEIMVFIARAFEALPALDVDRLRRDERNNLNLYFVDGLMCVLAVVGHNSLFIYAVLDLWKLRVPAVFGPSDLEKSGLAALTAGYVAVFTFIFVLYYVNHVVACPILLIIGDPEDRTRALATFLTFGLTGTAIVMWLKDSDYGKFLLRAFSTGGPLATATLAGPICMIILIFLLCNKFPSIGEKLLVRQGRECFGEFCFHLFLSSTLSFVSYGILLDTIRKTQSTQHGQGSGANIIVSMDNINQVIPRW
jgi:hypothetical protein